MTEALLEVHLMFLYTDGKVRHSRKNCSINISRGSRTKFVFEA